MPCRGQERDRFGSNPEPELTAVVETVDAAGVRAMDQVGEDFVTAVFVRLDSDGAVACVDGISDVVLVIAEQPGGHVPGTGGR